MSYKLVIAEKPSVAQSIAKVIGADKREDGYLKGNRNIYRGVVKNPTIRMKMRNDKRDNEHRMIHCSGCGKFLATCKEVISLNIICPKCRTVTIADLKSGELKTIRDRRKNQI